jgi:hypothetical protein
MIYFLELLKIISKMVKVFIYVKIPFFKEYGKIIVNTVVIKLHHLDIILVNLKIIKEMDKDNIIGIMDSNMKGNG